MRQIYFDKKGIKKLSKLKNITITRTVIDYRPSRRPIKRKVDLNFKPNLNGFFRGAEDWITIEGITKYGFHKCYYYEFYTEEKLIELRHLLDEQPFDR